MPSGLGFTPTEGPELDTNPEPTPTQTTQQEESQIQRLSFQLEDLAQFLQVHLSHLLHLKSLMVD